MTWLDDLRAFFDELFGNKPPQKNTETLPTIEPVPIEQQQTPPPAPEIINIITGGEKLTQNEGFLSQPETAPAAPVIQTPRQQTLALGLIETKWTQPNGALSPDDWFRLSYNGTGIGYSNAILYSEDEALNAAALIESAGMSDKAAQEKLLIEAEKGNLARCNSGAITDPATCQAWQGGIDHMIAPAEIQTVLDRDNAMIADAQLIRSFLG